MATLILGVAVSPVFSNGVAFAQTNEEQRAAEMDAKRAEKQAISDQKKSQRASEMDAKRLEFQERFSNMPEEKQQALQGKFDAMQEKRNAMQQNRESMKAQFADMTPEERQTAIQEIRDKRSAERDARQNMTTEERQALIDTRIAEVKEKRENYVSPRAQIGLGLAPEDIICAEGKELVVRVSNGMPMCFGSDAVLVLMDRGIIAYPE